MIARYRWGRAVRAVAKTTLGPTGRPTPKIKPLLLQKPRALQQLFDLTSLFQTTQDLPIGVGQ
jgi:hypothetical protein